MDNPDTKPSADAVLARAASLASEAMYTLELQRRRLRSTEPEDERFLFRWWADLQFFIVTLRRLRRCAELVGRVSGPDTISAALKDFDAALPAVQLMRNVGEHLDDYALDSPSRRTPRITRHYLQTGEWDGTTFTWLDSSLNVDDAVRAAGELSEAVRAAGSFVGSSRES